MQFPSPKFPTLLPRCALPGLLLLAAGCLTQSPVGTTHVGPERRASEVCALYSDDLSASTTWFLQLIEADEDFEEDPLAVLEDLHTYALEEPRRSQAYSLAELSYLAGKRTGDRGAYLLSGADGSQLAVWTGLEPGDHLGWGATIVGDLDGDGAPELLLPAPFSAAAHREAGRVLVISGAP